SPTVSALRGAALPARSRRTGLEERSGAFSRDGARSRRFRRGCSRSRGWTDRHRPSRGATVSTTALSTDSSTRSRSRMVWHQTGRAAVSGSSLILVINIPCPLSENELGVQLCENYREGLWPETAPAVRSSTYHIGRSP